MYKNPVPQVEYTKTNSIYSSMRWAFMKVAKFWLYLTGFIVISIVAAGYVSAFTTKPVVLPVGALVGVIATVGTIAFGGKALQSATEPNAPEEDTMKDKKDSNA